MTLDDFFRDYIKTWEGGLSLDPDDSGNWFRCAGVAPVLTGSNFGVTAAALADYRGCTTITPADIACLTLDDAAKLGERLYYQEPGIDQLPWDPLVASMVDFGWGAGPVQAIMSLQRLIAVAADGKIGRFTTRAYAEFVAGHGIAAAATQWQTVRNAFYRTIVERRPVNAKYLNGWTRRSAYYAPNTDWWRRFTA